MIALLLNTLPTKYRSKVEELYYEYKDVMLYVAMGIVKEKEQAQDIVHHAFIRIIKHIEKIDGLNDKEAKGYIVFIVRNLAIDHVRKQKREITLSYDDMEYGIEDKGESTESIVMLDFEVSMVKKKLKDLDEKYSLPLIMKYTMDFSQEQIAHTLNISVQNVKVRCHRGRKMLMDAIRKEAGR